MVRGSLVKVRVGFKCGISSRVGVRGGSVSVLGSGFGLVSGSS